MFRQLGLVLHFYLRFLLSFTQIGFVVRRLFWSSFKADFRGQHWLVTGGSGGLGRAVVYAALRGGATVTVAARSAQKLEALIAELAAAGLKGADTQCCDFTLVADTDALIERLAAQGRPIDVLINNVGVLNNELLVTREGLEASFVSNVLSHYQLTEGLIARGLLHSRSVVVNVTSGGGYHFPLQAAMLNVTDPARYSGVAAYGFHKRAQMVLNRHWSNIHHDRGIVFYVMHPGWADTAGVQRSLPRFRQLLKAILRDSDAGADTIIWLVAHRPSQPADERVWFDRKIRPAHVYSHTRQSTENGESLAKSLQNILTERRNS
jgi:dehydrogenase/reductase SDR family protein 12